MTEKVYFSASGYLCYKMINSQNLLSEMQVQNFILLSKKLCSVFDFFKRYWLFCIFNVPMIFQIWYHDECWYYKYGYKRRSSDSPSGYFISKITLQKHRILDKKSSFIIFGG